MPKHNVQVIPFDTKYTHQVKQLVIEVHREFGFAYDRKLDADLDDIPGVYKGNGGFWIALNHDTVIGTCAIRGDTLATATLKRLYVLPVFRGEGIGGTLLHTAVEHARQHGFKEIQLDTSPAQKRAITLYERYGFVKTKENGQQLFYRLIL